VSKLRPDIIERFGGHAMAAGLTIKKETLELFTELFEQAVAETASAESFDRVVYTDGALAPEEITFGLVDALSSRIWGQGFERPIFANDFTVLSQRVLKDTHLRLVLDLSGNRFEGIFFRRNEPLSTHAKLAYRPEINEYLGRRSIQLVIEAVES
jgi:single-stranded-DNA-specific exonuclease